MLSSNEWQYSNRRKANSYRLSAAQLARRAIPAVAAVAYKAYKSKPKQKSVAFVVKPKVPYRPSETKSLKKQVKAIQKEIKSEQATLIYKKTLAGPDLVGVRSQSCTNLEGIAMAQMEVALAELRFFNPATPGTLTQASGATATYQRSYHFKSMFATVDAVNNYQVPCIVKIYAVTPKEDTSVTPPTAFTNGLADVGNPTSTSMHLDLTDSPQFNQLWKIQKTIKKTLAPGAKCSLSYAVKDIMYDPALFDSHALAYQRKYGNFAFVIRVMGVIGHDTVTANQVTTLQSGVDIYQYSKILIEYDAGIDLKYIVLNEAAVPTSFTTSGVVSSKPVADNIPYSLA